jgi:iron complex outermembrane receptor protein
MNFSRLRSNCAFLLLAAAPVHATPSDGAQPGDETAVKLEAYVVTGSNIPTAADATIVPVSVVGRQEMEQTGLNSNLLELLRKDLPSIAGRSNTGNTNANNTNQVTAGGSQLAIRNLDTLILINGRRLATSSVNGIGGKNFVDINEIPVAAIERIEVLADGASATYGSDAIGGVINLILKSDYQGAEFGGRYAVASSAGHYAERSAYVTAGAGGSGLNVTVSGSWSKTDPLYQSQRPFSQNFTGKTTVFPGVAGGAYLNPNYNSPRQNAPVGSAATAPNLAALIANGTYLAATDPTLAPGIAYRFNAAPYQTILLSQDQRAAVVAGTADLIGRKLTWFGDYLHSLTQSQNQTFLARSQITTVSVPAGAPFNPLTAAFPGVVFGDLNEPLRFHNHALGDRVTAGFKGIPLEHWSWEAAMTYDRNDLIQQLKGLPYLPNLTRAIAGGYDANGNPVAGGGYSRVLSGFSETGTNYVIQPALDPFARTPAINPASLSNVIGTEVIHSASSLLSYDAKIVGEPVALPGGRLGFAIGASERKEKLSSVPDEDGTNTGPGNHRWGGSGTYFDPFSASRTVQGYFVETRVPLTGPDWHLPAAHALDLSLAGRIEHYSDSGTSRVPKVGVRWQPVDEQVTIRFNYSKAFTAPTLYALFGPTTTSKTASTLLATALNNPAFNGLVANSQSNNNPNLKPTQAWSRSFGMVVSPKYIPGLTISADYVDVFQKGFFSTVGGTSIIQSVDKYGTASPFLGNFAFNNYPGSPGATAVTGAGQITQYLLGGGNSLNMYTQDHMINLSGVHVQAVDLALNYETIKTGAGRFAFSSSAELFPAFNFKALPDQPYYQYSGYATNGGTGQQGTVPKYRVYSTLVWYYRSWDTTLGNTYIPAVTDVGAGGDVLKNSTILKPRPVDRYVTWDLALGYTFDRSRGRAPFSTWRKVRIAVGVNNAFNRMPPAAPQAYTDNTVDVSTYSAVGRLYFVSGSVKF